MISMKRKIIVVGLALALIIALVGGCAKTAVTTTSSPAKTTPAATVTSSTKTSATSTASAWDKWKADYDAEIAKLVAGAKQEGGKLTIYGGTRPKEQMDAERDYFKKQYGIDLDWLVADTTQTTAKIQAEQAAKQYVGDVFWSGTQVLLPVAKNGFMIRYIPPAALEPGVKWYIDPLYLQNDKVVEGKGLPLASDVNTYGAAYNTKLVPAAKVPKTWDDFLDPTFTGKIVSADPRVPGGANGYYMYQLRLKGEGYMKKLWGDQHPTIQRDIQIMLRQLGAGEHYLTIGLSQQMMAGWEDAPIKFIYPEGAIIYNMAMGVLNGAPHPNAAKLYINYRLSKEGQQLGNKVGGTMPLRADVKAITERQDLTQTKIIAIVSSEDDSVGKPQAQAQAKTFLAGLGYK